MINDFKTTLLLAGLTGLLLFLGNLLGGNQGMVFALIFAAVMNIGAYWFSDKLVLKMYKAEPVSSNHPLYQLVAELAKRGDLPMPKVYVIPTNTPNAFATGRNPQHAAVAATEGLIKRLTPDELMGVMAHEMSHVKHHDTLISAIAATIGGAIAMLASMAQWAMIFGSNRNNEGGGNVLGGLLAMILAPIAASLIQMAVSRSREYAADEAGAKLCGNPLSLANALRKLEAANQQAPIEEAQTHPATAHLFIVNPLSGQKLKNLFSTHPATEERIRRLEAMAKKSF